jgi:CheY-like chemotaxis protein
MSLLNTVLIVDDEPLGQETLTALLNPLGCQLVFASNGGEALRQAAAALPDLILLDVMMPGIDGYEVCRRLRAHPLLAEVPVIMITALDDRDSRLRGIEAGADDFVSKPFDRVELRSRVRTITRLNRYRRLVNARAQFEWVVDQSDSGYLIVERSGAITYANPQARLYLGAPAVGSELDGTFLELAAKHYQVQPFVTWADWVALPAGDPTTRRCLVRPPSASSDIFMLQADLLEMAPDPEQRYLIRLRDITASVIDQQSVWTFQALVRHKLGTAMAQLIGGLRLIEGLRLAPADGTLAALFTIASNGAERLQADINDVFAYMDAPDLARPEHGFCALAELPALIAEIKTAQDSPAIRFDQRVPVDHAPIELAISRRALGLILAELIENARKFHPRRSPTIDIAIRRDGNMLHLCVRDDGQSLTADQLARVWLPYYQGERYFTGQVPGMGLGLSMVATLMWRAGGAYAIGNRQPGPGIEVELTIPIAESV